MGCAESKPGGLQRDRLGSTDLSIDLEAGLGAPDESFTERGTSRGGLPTHRYPEMDADEAHRHARADLAHRLMEGGLSHREAHTIVSEHFAQAATVVWSMSGARASVACGRASHALSGVPRAAHAVSRVRREG